MGKKFSVQGICVSAVLMALICIATLFFKVPIPLGYAHLGNGFIFIAAFLLSNPEGMIVAGVGSALADLLGGYTEWILPTLIIKCAMGYALSLGFHHKEERVKIISVRTAVSLVIGSVIMVFGYFVAGSILYGNIVTGAAQIPGLVAEDIVGVVVFFAFVYALERAGVMKRIVVFAEK